MIKVLNSTCIFLIIFLLLFPGCSEKKVISQHPNIIYILADDLGYGDVSSFNPESKIRTPNIDRLAAGGMRFTDAHTSSSVCTPTRYGILTGRYNWRSTLKKGVLWGMSEALIPADRTTVASLLNENGYHTAFIGKWHLGWNWSIKPDSLTGKPDFDDIDYSKAITNAPNSLGFDYAYGHPASLDMPPYVYVENEMVTASPDRVTVDKGKYSWWRKGPTGSDFMHEEVTPNFFNRAVSYIQDQAGNDNPFFLYLALPSPHTPILPTKEWQGASNLLPYADFVMMIDSFMGKLTDAVEQAGISKNTLIIFTSDNGCSPAAGIDSLEAQGHYPGYIYRGHKADIFEGGHRVPFIARWPDKIAKGSTSHHTICTVDLLATCAEIINDTLADDEGEDSYSMLPLFEQNLNRSAFREATVHHSVNGSFALRKGKWKLIMCPGSGGWSFPKPDNALVIDKLPDIQLYNLVDDPGETKNLQAEYPDTVKVLKTLLTTYIVGGRSTPGIPQQNEGSLDDWPQTDFVHE